MLDDNDTDADACESRGRVKKMVSQATREKRSCGKYLSLPRLRRRVCRVDWVSERTPTVDQLVRERPWYGLAERASAPSMFRAKAKQKRALHCLTS